MTNKAKNLKLKIEHIPILTLIPYPGNAKAHPEAQVQKIAGSIKEFGFVVPLILDADNGIIAGHGRYLAAQVLSLDTVPCVRAADLTPAQVKALRITDNRVTESDWLPDLLEIEIVGD